jgi:hypothetical protein
LGKFSDGFLGVDTQMHQSARAKSIEVYLMEGVYVYHWYRADTGGRATAARSLPELLACENKLANEDGSPPPIARGRLPRIVKLRFPT